MDTGHASACMFMWLRVSAINWHAGYIRCNRNCNDMHEGSKIRKTRNNSLTARTLTVVACGKTPKAWLLILSCNDKHHLFLACGAKYSATNFFQ